MSPKARDDVVQLCTTEIRNFQRNNEHELRNHPWGLLMDDYVRPRGLRLMQRQRHLLASLAVAGVLGATAAVATAGGPTPTELSQTHPDTPSAGRAGVEPLKLRPGSYVYQVDRLSAEATTADGQVLHAAELGGTTWRLEYRNADSWTEFATDDRGNAAERTYDSGHYTVTVDGELVDQRRSHDLAVRELHRSRGSDLPDGGPHLALNPYGGSFLLTLERAANQEAHEAGFRASESETTKRCEGGKVCRKVDFIRDIKRPAGDHAMSLQWSELNEERVTLVYDTADRLVHEHTTTLNGAPIYRFELLAAP